MGLEACALCPHSGGETVFMPELPDGGSCGGVPPENCSVRGASSLVRSPLPCCCSGAVPCTLAVLPTLVGRLPKNGGHHQAVCRLGPTPFLSLGARGACLVHGVPRCPQVTGLQVTRATSLLPGYGSPSTGGEPTGLISPQGQPMGDPTAPPSQAVNSGPLTWRESPQALSPLQAGPGHPTAPLSQAYLDYAQRWRTRGRTNLLHMECLGSSGQPGSRANQLGMAGSPSTMWPQ